MSILWLLLFFFNGIPICSLFFVLQISYVTFPLFYSILLSPCCGLLELFFPFLAWILFLLTLIIFLSLSFQIIFLYCRHLIFSFLFCVILIPFWSLLIFAQLTLILILLWFIFNSVPVGSLPFKFYFKPHSILFPFLTPFCHHPSLFYLHFKFYFLPFFDFLKFPTLIISPPSSSQNHFSFL